MPRPPDPGRLRLKPALLRWFTALREERNLSFNTIAAYKDAWRLLFRFGTAVHGLPVTGDWRIGQIDRTLLLDWLQSLEKERGCTVRTRNARLAAVHSFFQYLRRVEPDTQPHCDRLLSIPAKRAARPVIGYLEVDELRAVWDGVDLSRPDGKRDLALLAFAYNTGARVHEMAGLLKPWLSFGTNPSVRIWGKGRKERELPLFPGTVKALQAYLRNPNRKPRNAAAEPFVFLSLRGTPLTRFGVAEILERAFERAAVRCPAIQRKHVTAHGMRHTTAVHLLHGGASLVSIQNWLGHASLNSVQTYVTLDLKNKRDILERCLSLDYVTSKLSQPQEQDEGGESAEDWLDDV